MNINENFCNERKNLRKIKGCTYKMTNVYHVFQCIKHSANSMLRHCTFLLPYRII